MEGAKDVRMREPNGGSDESREPAGSLTPVLSDNFLRAENIVDLPALNGRPRGALQQSQIPRD